MDRTVLEKKSLAELREIASTLELSGYQRIKKADLVSLIIDAASSGAAADRDGSADGAEPAGGGANETGSDEDRSGGRVRARRRDGDERQDGSDRPAAVERSGSDERSGDGGRSGDADRGSASRTSNDGDGQERAERDGNGNGPQRGPSGTGQGREDDRERAKRERRRKNRGSGQQGGQGGQGDDPDAEVREGVLDLLPEGYGFLRVTGFLAGERDVYVSQSFVRRFDLRRGDRVSGPIRRSKNNDKFPALARVETVEGEPLPGGQPQERAVFGDATALPPDERFVLAHDGATASRLVDLFAPVGKGQRGLIIAPPKAGTTTIIKQIASALEANEPDVHVMIVLVDERPEEVTDVERSTDAEVISSTFDRPAEDHTQVAELAIERAKRLVERGQDVVVLLDSLTRLARAYNLTVQSTGRSLSGVIDAGALYPPKRLFGAARNVEGDGSLTIIATAAVETGSRTDEVILEEFAGTANMELRLDRTLERRRRFPAIDLVASSTRREDLLLDADELDTVWELRRQVAALGPEAGLTAVLDALEATDDNAAFLRKVRADGLSAD
jgi:transcription termination factor Rho